MVEQRPFKALAAGSSPAQPSFCVAWVYIRRGAPGRHCIGSTEDLERRLSEHRRAGNHTTHRMGNDLELIASARLDSIAEARILEIQLKRKKNPRIAIAALTARNQNESSPETIFGVGSGFESRPTQYIGRSFEQIIHTVTCLALAKQGLTGSETHRIVVPTK